MSKIKISSTNINDAKLYIDGQEIKFVRSVEINMAAGENPVVKLEVLCTEGLDLDIDEALISINKNQNNAEIERLAHEKLADSPVATNKFKLTAEVLEKIDLAIIWIQRAVEDADDAAGNLYSGFKRLKEILANEEGSIGQKTKL